MHQPENCKNCETVLHGAHFCPTCSQQADTHRLSIQHTFHELFHALTHADAGVLFTLKELALRPGVVAREYVEGKRKKYFNPYTLFFLTLSVILLMNTFIHPFSQLTDASIQQASPEARVILQRVAKFQHFVESKQNLVSMLAIPLISFVYWLVYRKGKNYAEHLLANILFATFTGLVRTVSVYPFMGYYKGTSAYYLILVGSMVLQVIYYAWGYFQFLQLKGWRGAATAFFVSLLGTLTWAVFSQAIGFVYIRYGFFWQN